LKLTKTTLLQIIKEEIAAQIKEKVGGTPSTTDELLKEWYSAETEMANRYGAKAYRRIREAGNALAAKIDTPNGL